MRNGQNNNNKRMRNNNRSNNNHNNNNNNNNRRGQNPMTRVYESNGPDIKIRGTASHIAEKYLQLARDSRTSSDPVAAENYYQHAEHYFRLIATAQEQFRQNQPQHQPRADNGVTGDVQVEDGEDESENFSNFGAEPGFTAQQREQQQQPRERDNYQPRNEQPRQHRERGEQPYPREARQPQPQPQYQPQPAVQASENIGLPSFITGGAPQPANGAPVEQAAGEANGEPRFPPRRRRRPHAPRPDAAAAPAAVGEDFNS